MKIGIINEYEIDLINALKFLEFDFFYFIIDSEEKRKYYNIFLFPFTRLEKYYNELDVILNFSNLEFSLEKIINKIEDVSRLKNDKKFWIYRNERTSLDNVFYFPYVIDENIPKSNIDFIFENKNKKTALIICDKISIEVVGVISILSKEFEIYIYGIQNLNKVNSKNIYFLDRKLDKVELIKLLRYIDIVLDFSKDKFYSEILYAAFLNKPVLTTKYFKNFPKLKIDENFQKNVSKMLKIRIKYDIQDNLIKNAREIIREELKRLEKVILEKNK